MIVLAAAASSRRSIVAATGALWAAQIVVAIGAVIRGKTGAELLGTSGVGLIAQLNMFSVTVGTMATLGVATGAVRAGAAARAVGDLELEREIRAVVLFVPVTCALALAALFSAASPFLDDVLLGEDGHAIAVSVAALSVPLGIVGSSFMVTLQSQGRMGRVAGGTIVVSILSTALVVGLIVGFGLRGAIAGVALTSVVSSAVYIVREPRLFHGVRGVRRRVPVSRRAIRAIYSIGLASFALGALSAIADLVTRSIVVHLLGVAQNGLFQAVSVVSQQLFLGLVGALSVYLLPQLTGLYAAGREAEAVHETNVALQLLLAVVAPLGAILVLFSRPLLRLVFAADFVAAAPALHAQMVAEIFRSLSWVVGAALLPLGLVRAWLAIGVATLAVQVSLTAALVPVLGLRALPVAAGAGWGANALAAFVVTRRATSFRLTARTVALALGAFALVGLATMAGREGSTIAAVATTLAAVAFAASAGGAQLGRLRR